MPASPTKTQRWLDLIAFLTGRRFPVSVEQIMEGVPAYAAQWVEGSDTARASVRRKFERDKDELRDFGIPIGTVKYRLSHGPEEVEGYRLADRDFYLPYLELLGKDRPARAGRAGAALADVFEVPEAEIAPALLGLRRVAALPDFPLLREARSAYRKLTYDLGEDAAREDPVLYAAAPETEELRGALRELTGALLRRKTVRFRYHGMYRDDVTDRVVRPYALLYQHAHWYLIGHDEGWDDLRVFRADRMEDVEVNAGRANSPDFDAPADFDVARFAGKGPWDLGGDAGDALSAAVRFAFPRSLWAERNRVGELTAQHADGSATRTFRVLQTEPFVRWLLSLEGDARVESPPELEEAFRDAAARVAALYRAGSPEDVA